MEELMRASDAARMLKVTRKTIYLWARYGKLDTVKIAGQHYFTADAVARKAAELGIGQSEAVAA